MKSSLFGTCHLGSFIVNYDLHSVFQIVDLIYMCTHLSLSCPLGMMSLKRSSLPVAKARSFGTETTVRPPPLHVVETNAYALLFYFISLFVTVQTRASTTLMR